MAQPTFVPGKGVRSRIGGRWALAGAAPPPPRGRQLLTPAGCWGLLGLASLILIGIVLARWLAAGHAAPISPGSSALPAGQSALLELLQWGSVAALMAILWRYLVWPLLRRRPLGFDGLLVAGLVVLNFWDPLDNYWAFAFQYNAHFINVASWGSFIPGWHSANGERWVVPVAFVVGTYVWGFFIGVRLAAAVMAVMRGTRAGWVGALPAAVPHLPSYFPS